MNKQLDAEKIKVYGCRENNLKNINLEIPRGKMSVFTGLSGSGKSTLAFDTIFTEGQRRYIQSLSAYARQFLGQFEKPDIDFATGLSPAVSIDQKSTNRNPRSTVGTITEIYDYLRLLFARVGDEHCMQCLELITSSSAEEIVNKIMQMPLGTKIRLLAPLVSDRKGEYIKELDKIKRLGFSRVRIDGDDYELTETIELKRNVRHNIEVIVDRIILKEDIEKRLTDSVELSLNTSGGQIFIEELSAEKNNASILHKFSSSRSCPNDHELLLENIEPRTFSFNAHYGACPQCEGIGYKKAFDIELMIPNPSLSLAQGAIEIAKSPWYQAFYAALSDHMGFKLSDPWKKLSPKVHDAVLHGLNEPIKVSFTSQYDNVNRVYTLQAEGILNMFKRRYREAYSDAVRVRYEQYMRENPCSACGGARLKPEVLCVLIDNKSIFDIVQMPINTLLKWVENLNFTGSKLQISNEILKEIKTRLGFMVDVGLHYLTLSRSASTLSGGEAQRIRLATQIGAGLVGVMYVLDEPSIGLHQHDNQKLIKSLLGLRDLGNTLIVVEHDEETMQAADHIVDIGPLAGAQGGQIVHSGDFKTLLKNKRSLTGQYLSGLKKIEIPKQTRHVAVNTKGIPSNSICVLGASENNLKNIDVAFPLGVLTCVTGVSGSGKSTLVNTTLYRALHSRINRASSAPGRHKDLKGADLIEKVIHVHQGPIGRTPRSNPATYIKVWDEIRSLFANLPASKELGFRAGRFSFNVPGGRCEECQGDGLKKIEMNFLPDVYVPCETCFGKRYNKQTLLVKLKGKTIADILDMTIDDACIFFEKYPKISHQIKTLVDVGLGYLKLGQSATTLSGGEAQRVKLALELQKRFNKKTLYILDEPTTGLHFEDINKLLKVLQSLVDKGNSVLVIEHNLDVIKCADWVIDMGPQGGDAGGYIIAQGTPKQIANNPKSITGRYLAKLVL